MTAQADELVSAGARRLIARAEDARSLGVEALSPRIGAALNKYLRAGEAAAEPSAEAINQFIDGLHADDLCLIVACERGDERAWSDLVERFGATVRSAARSASSNEDSAEDLAQSIWAELHGLRIRADGRPSGKIAYYSGRGSLGGWLRAVVGQLAVDQHRKASRMVQTEDDADFDRLAQDSHTAPEGFGATNAPLDPEQALAEGRAAVDVESALARALGELEAEDRLLVKLYYFDGLRLREAGAVLGVHEATASRRLARVHVEIRQRVEAILTKEHGWTREETARSLAEAASHLDTDLQLMLTTEKASSEKVTGRDE
ncbi:MAG TPA: sigma-70 family RNA polymerase sigma factor [Pyrinomonadaceae bacterium]|jgi:RNA polymerase sigma-70 factor (ECF subfamily)|nr:sigma-70 family RNA polymerase sigma factor [Pyrinomonadaceae bacterium]